jgi:hypothetical protein
MHRKTSHVLLAGALIYTLPSGAAKAQEDCSERKVIALLGEIRALIASGRSTDALDKIDYGVDIVGACRKKKLELSEEYYWEAGIQNLEFADRLTNQKAYRDQARKARTKWNDYISWYAELAPEDRGLLSSGHSRIQKATALLGAALLRMEEPRDLLEDYEQIADPSFLGVDAITIWKEWLYRCPDWRSTARTTAIRRQKICNSECRSDWEAYADALAEWAANANLTQAAKARALRQTEQIRQDAAACPPE